MHSRPQDWHLSFEGDSTGPVPSPKVICSTGLGSGGEIPMLEIHFLVRIEGGKVPGEGE